MSANRLCKTLGIEKPIIQGPMSWVATAPLVIAVAKAGAFGVLGTAVAEPAFIASQCKQVREKTGQPFGINMAFHPFFLNKEYFASVLSILKEYSVTAVHLDTACDASRRLEADFSEQCFEQWHNNGIKVIAKVFTMADALTAEKAGADVILVKGWEGGGHTTMQTTMVLIPQAAECISVPIVGSGGIVNGRSMAAAMILGADGVEMGTVFLAAQETDIEQAVKDEVVRTGDFATVEIGISTPMPCRQIRNSLSEEVQKLESMSSYEEAAPKIMKMTEKSLKMAMKDADLEHGAVMAGQAVALVKQIRPAGEIIDLTLAECEKTLQSAPSISLK